MPKIVGIHGIGHQYGGPNSLATSWVPAINDGLIGSAKSVAPSDFHCAFFGDLFREEPVKGETPEGPETKLEEELVLLFWREARRSNPELPDPNEVTKGRVDRLVQVGLDVLVSTPLLRSLLGTRLVIKTLFQNNLRQVSSYLFDAHVRQKVQSRFLQMLDESTEVIVAHSLGTIVAYECLFHPQAHKITTFVTLGSPLGIERVIFDRLTPPPIRGLGLWPKALRSWSNIAAPDDYVALRKKLGEVFKGGVEDFLVNNGNEPHSAVCYLTSKECGKAIAKGI